MVTEMLYKEHGIPETGAVNQKEVSKRKGSLVDRMKRGAYKPQPSRRVYIPKDGKGKMRPLGISKKTA